MSDGGTPGADDLSDDGADNGGVPSNLNIDEPAPDLPPQEVDRVFRLMEEAVNNDSLEGAQLERLLSVLERTVAAPSETNPETVAELISILENIIVEPDDLGEVDIDGFLSVIEDAIAGTTAADEDDIAELFGIIEESITDPTRIEPEDIERFQSVIEGAIVDITDPGGRGIGGLFPFPGLTGTQPENLEEDDALDMFRIARVAAGMTQRATGYSMESGIRTGTRMAYAAGNSESPVELLRETRAITLDELQRAGVDIGDEQVDWLQSHEDELADGRPVTKEALRKRGERLLSQSAEVGRDETLHPAFGSFLDELAGDEARILRLLATEGVQPTMDVHDRSYLPFKSRMVAENLTMLGSDSGCRHADRTPIYLQNLERLGLIAFSEEPVGNLKRYQVLEAQPHVEEARDAAKRPKTSYGSVSLTDLGIDFCETCLPITVTVERSGTRFRRDANS